MVAASSEYLVLLLQKPTFNQWQDYETKLILVNTGHKALPASDKISLCQLTHLRWSYSAIGMCFWKFAPRPSAVLGNVLHFCSPDYSGTRLSQSGVLHSRCGEFLAQWSHSLCWTGLRSAFIPWLIERPCYQEKLHKVINGRERFVYPILVS
jgi:hypothetical protein